jgi:hypothetical protein
MSAITATNRIEQDHAALLRAPRQPVLVDVPEFQFAMVDGMGDPSTSADYQTVISALYAVSYPLVIGLKREGVTGLKVAALEGLWWAADLEAFDPARRQRDSWQWRMMIRQPDEVTLDRFDAVRAKAAAKVGREVADRLRLERFREGRSAQMMHRGPYADEGPNIALLHEFIHASGLERAGKHHEIYLTDPRRSAPENMRTVLRQPVATP